MFPLTAKLLSTQCYTLRFHIHLSIAVLVWPAHNTLRCTCGVLCCSVFHFLTTLLWVSGKMPEVSWNNKVLGYSNLKCFINITHADINDVKCRWASNTLCKLWPLCHRRSPSFPTSTSSPPASRLVATGRKQANVCLWMLQRNMLILQPPTHTRKPKKTQTKKTETWNCRKKFCLRDLGIKKNDAANCFLNGWKKYRWFLKALLNAHLGLNSMKH